MYYFPTHYQKNGFFLIFYSVKAHVDHYYSFLWLTYVSLTSRAHTENLVMTNMLRVTHLGAHSSMHTVTNRLIKWPI